MGVLFALLAAVPATMPTAQAQVQPQCSDGVDNDADGERDGADAGCSSGSDDDEADSIYSGIILVTVPLPVLTIQGTVDSRGTVTVSKLLVRALRGSTVAITCSGRACPFKTLKRIMITSTLRLGKLERRLKAPLTLTMRIARPGQLGKYVRYVVRRRKPPKRTDQCLDQATGKVRGCFTG